MNHLKTLLTSTTALGLCLPLQAAVVADFDAGAGTTMSAEFPGSAGAGWVTGWNPTTRTGQNAADQSLNTSDPIAGAGSLLLESSRMGDYDGSATRSNTYRQWDGSGGVDPTSPFVVSFVFRVDALEGNNQYGDFLQFFLRGSAQTSGNFNSGVGGVRVNGAGVFQVRSGTSNIALDGDLAFNLGDLYHYEATIDPTTATWDLILTNLTKAESYTVEDLAFGSGYDGVDYVHFGTSIETDPFELFPGTFDDSTTVRNAWTVDSLAMTAVPEPASLALLTAGGLVMSLRHRA